LKGLIAFVLIILFLICGVFGLVRYQESVEYQEYQENQKPLTSVDSDDDGFSDKFEEQMDSYDPNIQNDRYVVLFSRYDDPEHFTGMAEMETDSAYQFFTQKGNVPPENITILKEEEATAISLESAIHQIAEKSDENDIIYLNMQCHGYIIGRLFNGYQAIDEWLDEIEAKVVIVQIMACGSERALPVWKDGPCPRIVFVQSAGEFIGGLGTDSEYFITVDSDYGDNNGYVSVGEIGNWRNNVPRGWKDREYEPKEDGYWNGKSWIEKEGYSLMSDTSDVASEIYLTDYKVPS